MAFLLSPKTGGGAVSYAFAVSTAGVAVSINGTPAQIYTIDNPGTVRPGDVLSVPGAEVPRSYNGIYIDAMTETAQPVKTVSGAMPHIVEDVPGAVALVLNLQS